MIDDLLERRNNSDNYGDRCIKNILRGYDERSDWQSIVAMSLELKSHIFDKSNYSFMILDQLRLPHHTEYVVVEGVADGYAVIKNMQVRGAPLIATVGMLALVVELKKQFNVAEFSRQFSNLQSALTTLLRMINEKCEFLRSSRPTAVNLTNVISELLEHLHERFESNGSFAQHLGIEEAVQKVVDSVEYFIFEWQSRERFENDLLIRNSIAALDSMGGAEDKKLVIMTICNTGSLATSSFGTCLGVIVHLHRLGRLRATVALETRPYLQGARLTAYELRTNNVPFVLIADSMAAFAMKNYRIDAVLVGADQVALNGDTANKIGTYMLAVTARHHCIPFFVVTPTSSVNPRIYSGDEIHIEERPAVELTHFNGQPLTPDGCAVWNPAFDVTPGSLIDGILTERGNFAPVDLRNAFAPDKVI